MPVVHTKNLLSFTGNNPTVETTKNTSAVREPLDIIKRDSDFVIFRNDRPFLTPGGREFCHPDERFLKNVLSDLQDGPGEHPGSLRPSLIYILQADCLSEGKDPVLEQFPAFSDRDIFIRMKTKNNGGSGEEEGKHDWTDPEEEMEILQQIFWSLTSVLQCLNAFIEEHISRMEDPEEHEHPFLVLLKHHYTNAPVEKKAALQALCYLHDAGFVLPFLFILGKLSAGEYTRGVRAVGLRRSRREEKTGRAERILPFEKTFGDEGGIPRDLSSKEIFRDACVAADYISFTSFSASPHRQVSGLLSAGESAALEFKSTLRWDLKAGKTNPAVERACLKTICAFLNSNGGTLLIGVRDDGSVEGIGSDRFANEDKFLLHLWTLIRTSLGRDVSPWIESHIVKTEGKAVCIVSAKPATRPVFLRQPGFAEEFYIRLGPASGSLDISEALKYIADRFRQE
jgi:hypothetical protein